MRPVEEEEEEEEEEEGGSGCGCGGCVGHGIVEGAKENGQFKLSSIYSKMMP